MCLCVCVCERERERERDKEGKCVCVRERLCVHLTQKQELQPLMIPRELKVDPELLAGISSELATGFVRSFSNKYGMLV